METNINSYFVLLAGISCLVPGSAIFYIGFRRVFKGVFRNWIFYGIMANIPSFMIFKFNDIRYSYGSGSIVTERMFLEGYYIYIGTVIINGFIMYLVSMYLLGWYNKWKEDKNGKGVRQIKSE